MNRKQKKMLARILITGALLVVYRLLPVTGTVRLALYLAAYGLIGWDILRKAARGLCCGRVFDENFLMALATLGAFLLAVITKSGDYVEGIAVMLFYQVGELFQSCAVGKSRRNISALMDIRPDHANLETEGSLVQVEPEQVPTGSIIVVQPGERVPLDGVVTEGVSTLNTGALTGESLPRDVAPGDEILSGCININGVLKVRTTREFGQSAVSRILDLVESAGSRKSRSEAFISRFARIYTPAVCMAAAALALLPPTAALLLGQSADWSRWLYRALTFLVVSCPCALVISIPLGFFAGIGGAGKAGILIKGSNYLEALAHTKYVVMDKTGTLTKGVFEVTEIRHSTMEREKLLEYAALAECASSHPISKSLRLAYGKEICRSRAVRIREHSGRGVTAAVDGHEVAVGNDKLMAEQGIDFSPCTGAGTVVHVAVDGVYGGHMVISDVIKENSAPAIRAMKKAGIKKVIMLTGDSEGAAQQAADRLGVDQVFSRLLPADKVEKLEQLLAQRTGRDQIAFVGDGINDAPVLTRADIGIAMGAMGADAAIEAADVVLMDDDPMQIAAAIKIGRRCMAVVRQNIVFSLTVKFACLVCTAVGMANMWLAIFADVGVMVLAVLNAIRLLHCKRQETENAENP